MIETPVNNEILGTRSNGLPQSNAAVGTPLGLESYRKQGNQRASQKTAEQRERLVSLGASAMVFAHEVANPLQGISGCVQLIQSELEQKQIVDPFVTAMIQGSLREIDRLRRLLHDFRSLANPQTLDLQLVDLEKIIEDVLALQCLRYAAEDVAVKLECEHPLPRIALDARKITQVILNLCKNAVEAMPNGGCLSIRVHSSDTRVIMEIADNGIGVPDDVDIFQLFNTTKPGGSGLGLAVVEQIVSAHKGTITYSTEIGHGTTFTVELPAESSN
jgi:signal transduction histidine kinase